MKQKTKYSILLIIFLAAFFSSLFLSQGYACNSQGICEVDNTPTFIPEKSTNGYIGVFIFLIMGGLVYLQIENPTKQKRLLINYGTIIGSILAIYFLYIQFTLLEYYCWYCIIIDFGMIAALILLIFNW